MLSNRLVVSRAASSLLSWRLAVFIFHCLLVGCLGAALCLGAACARTGFRTVGGGCASWARRVDSNGSRLVAAALPGPSR